MKSSVSSLPLPSALVSAGRSTRLSTPPFHDLCARSAAPLLAPLPSWYHKRQSRHVLALVELEARHTRMNVQPVEIAGAVVDKVVEGDRVALTGRNEQAVTPRYAPSANLEGGRPARRVGDGGSGVVVHLCERDPGTTSRPCR
jgi:N-methylhydantoinase B/oxoprolinase/acetone carboxylase alpha subunit